MTNHANANGSESLNIAITGASGFVGSALVKQLTLQGSNALTLLTRRPIKHDGATIQTRPDFDFDLTSQDVVIHAAARAHVMNETLSDPLAEYRKINVHGSLALAKAALSAGVQRFIFISSIKVNGEKTATGQAFSVESPEHPEDAYGQSKWEAEQALKDLISGSQMELVILRPPLIYGPGVKGNFASLLRISQRRLPLPLGALSNSRSLISLDNLLDLIIVCLKHPGAANQTFLASDDRDLSTTELLKQLGDACGKPARLVPVPPVILQGIARMLGKKSIAERLTGNLQIDISHTRTTLDWEPPVLPADGFRRCFMNIDS